MMRILYIAFCLVWLVSPVSAERMVALVVGNAAYAHANSLANPVQDASAVASALERLGFEIILAQDLGQAGMRQSIGAFSAALEGADTALFFYAGHGMQLGGRNYLIPTDAQLENETDVALSTIPLDVIIAQMDQHAKTRIVFLDACRDNPFEARLTRRLGTSRSASLLGNGLAPIDTAGGTFVGFATDPGAVAFDGEGAHSPFTAALLEHIETPGLEINTMMTRVRADVFETTGRQQRPWSSSSLLEEVFLAPPAPAATPLADATAWEAARSADTAFAYTLYIDAFPEGLFLDLANARLAALSAEEPASEETTAEDTASEENDLQMASSDRTLSQDAPIAPPSDVPVCPVCPETVLIPAGQTTMGSLNGTPAERPEVVQSIPAFHMAVSEITVGDIRAFEEDSGQQVAASCFIWTPEGRMRKRNAASWRAPGFDVTDNSPAACVSWGDAQAYVSWLNTKDPDGGWRLPSEAEFEYAARAGMQTEYPWLGGLQYICANANGADASSRFRWRNTSCTDGSEAPIPASTFPATAFGLKHMIGNLWEWTADCWNPSHKGAHPDARPRLSGNCSSRVLRGGSWDDPVENLRSAYRVGIPATRRQANVGFRVARDAQ